MNNLNTIREQGFRALVSGLGTTGAVSFLQQFESGNGDYTVEREKLHDGITIEEISARIHKRKENQA